jgi:hypothetical protein
MEKLGIGLCGKLKPNSRRRTMIERLIVGSTGIGYAVVGVLQGLKGEYSNMAIWLGYSIAQVGLFINLK